MRQRFRKMSYDYKVIAEAKGVTVHAVRMAVKRGVLVPDDLKSLSRYLCRRECTTNTGVNKLLIRAVAEKGKVFKGLYKESKQSVGRKVNRDAQH